MIASVLAGSNLGALAAGHELSQSDGGFRPEIAPASDEGERAIKGFKAAPGFKIDLVAAEPFLANPVAFSIDNKGRFYVAETFRHGDEVGVLDIRGHMPLLDEELAAKTLDDRIKFMHDHYEDKLAQFSKASERIKLIWDADGDGKVDTGTVFSEGYYNYLDGIGAGVLWHNGDVFYTCIPGLYKLEDKNGDGIADSKEVLSYGYGVRIAFLGHDLHGLRIGPDGKLYFSIGDRGFSVKQDGRVITEPECGAVMRCNLDGSDFEVVHRGLRNPQELAFDDLGDLFTGDNNSDGGDLARWVQVVDGGDSGWRVGWQFIERPSRRGPWIEERLDRPETTGFWHLPPLANIGAGPSGLMHYSGVGLSSRYNGAFFLSDFRGSQSSLVHTIQMKQNGASFSVTNDTQLVTGFEVTDIEQGPDGNLYASDWVRGWNKNGKGRIYRLTDTAATDHSLVQQTKQIIGDGMKARATLELLSLLAHADQRVRQEAQFELVDRNAMWPLVTAARTNANQLARIHGIWGVGMLGRKNPAVMVGLDPLLKDSDPEIRAQTAKMMGDARYKPSAGALIALLGDADAPRAQFQAAIALGKLGTTAALEPVKAMLRANADKDAYLRHAGVMALLGITSGNQLVSLAKDESASLRMAALIALRMQHSDEVIQFLGDRDVSIRLEAVRAINDETISSAMPFMARMLNVAPDEKPFTRRLLNANFRVGTAANALAVAKYAANEKANGDTRVEALQNLAEWGQPGGRDHVTGLWRPIEGSRDANAAAVALRPVLNAILLESPGPVQAAAAQAAKSLRIAESGPALLALVQSKTAFVDARVAALDALAALNDAFLPQALQTATAASEEPLRKAATRLQAASGKGDPTVRLVATLEKGSIGEQQAALTALGELKTAKAATILGQWVDKLVGGTLDKELMLEVMEAADSTPALKAKVAAYQASLPASDDLANFRWAFLGGNADEGKKVFFEKPEASCVRCHKVNGEGGEIGPDLGKIAAVKNREYLLDSVVHPNKEIAKGYESVIVTLKNGNEVAGMLKGETGTELEINSPEDGPVKVKKADIKERIKGPSGMLEGLPDLISKRDLRNIVEYLSTLK
jgi:quinoprotein glucose dehydrogenase